MFERSGGSEGASLTISAPTAPAAKHTWHSRRPGGGGLIATPQETQWPCPRSVPVGDGVLVMNAATGMVWPGHG
eukprot:10507821-Alexandrium_andersonii.AAC.1